MESGLEDRNNLNKGPHEYTPLLIVSMESGLEDRNNTNGTGKSICQSQCLNGVRPRRPEQYEWFAESNERSYVGLNGVRPRRPEQFTAIVVIIINSGNSSQWSPA